MKKEKTEYKEEKNKLQKFIEWFVSKAIVFLSVVLVLLTISTIAYGYTWISSSNYLGEGFSDYDPIGYEEINKKIDLIKDGKTDIYTAEERQVLLEHINDIQDYIAIPKRDDCKNAYDCMLERIKEEPIKNIYPRKIMTDVIRPARKKGKEIQIDRRIMQDGVRLDVNSLSSALDLYFPKYNAIVPNLSAYLLSIIAVPSYHHITGINMKEYLLNYVDYIIEVGEFHE